MKHVDLVLENLEDIQKNREPLAVIYLKSPSGFDFEALCLHIHLKAFPKSERRALVEAVSRALAPFGPAGKKTKKASSGSGKKAERRDAFAGSSESHAGADL